MRPRLLLAVTDAQSVQLLRGQLAYAREAGADVYVMSSLGEPAARIAMDEGAGFLPIELDRTASPVRDLRAFWQIVQVVRELAPDLVDASTPKAGFLVTAAAWLNRVPVRIHTLRGLRHETTGGAMRPLLLAIEWATCRMAHRVICISPSLRERAVELGLVSAERAVALGAGSANGVDLQRFTRTPERVAAGRAFRTSHGIGASELVIGYVGRVARDKGLATLATAWQHLRTMVPSSRLVVVGSLDETDPVDEASLAALRADPRVVMTGWLEDVAPAYAAMDVVTLPSLREGFGNVLIEAAAMELPVVASRVPGCVDAVEDGATGVLVAPADASALTAALRAYLSDGTLRRVHGLAGRARVERLFRQGEVCRRLLCLYDDLLRGRGRGDLTIPAEAAS